MESVGKGSSSTVHHLEMLNIWTLHGKDVCLPTVDKECLQWRKSPLSTSMEKNWTKASTYELQNTSLKQKKIVIPVYVSERSQFLHNTWDTDSVAVEQSH